MASFEFKLEALLTHRQHIEKDKQRRVAGIQQQIQVLIRGIQETQGRIMAENKTLGVAELTGRLDMQYIAHEKKFVGNLYLRIAMAMEKVRGLEQTLVMARNELLEAARSRKVMEKLREKQWARWRAELDRKESAQLDDIASQATTRALIH